MPFDGGYKTPEQINRSLLIDELRRPQPDFQWTSVTSCAMGIAWKMGLCDQPAPLDVGRAIGLPYAISYPMFMRCGYPVPWWKPWRTVATPKDIARALERAPFI
jgi:hypothetical protein